MPEKTGLERREYERYTTDFEVEVRGLFQDGEAFIDHTRLHNISGGGVGLLSCFPTYYSIGQNLTLSISLPATDTLESFMLCEAIVKWIYPNDIANGIEKPTVIGLSIGKRSIEQQTRQSANDAGDGQLW